MHLTASPNFALSVESVFSSDAFRNSSPRDTRGTTAMKGSKRLSESIAWNTLSPENIDASQTTNATESRPPAASFSRQAASCNA